VVTQIDSHARGTVFFGPFRLNPRLRLLECENQAVELGGHAFDILCILVARAGEVVDKRDLVAAAWGSVVVGDGSLRLQINVLRKVLNDDATDPTYIRNVVGRGYCFVAPVRPSDSPSVTPASTSPSPRLGKLPAPPGCLVGREQAVEEVTALLRQWRFVTVVGPGGIGKTTVSVSAGHALAEQFDAVCFVDLGVLSDVCLVPSSVASALGLMVSSADPGPGLLAHLQDRTVLLILDSCDPVIDVVAALAERIFNECPRVSILTSCREPLRADCERIYHLSALEVPADVAGLTAEQALGFSAVELFVSRAQASAHRFELCDSNVAIVVAMCRKLDGIPLAIELAARRVAALGLETTAGLLNSRFALAWRGRRTAVPRHRTLGAALAWSVELLDESERATLMCLAVFAGALTLEAAQAVAGSTAVDPVSTAEALTQLVEKSLVSSMPGPKTTIFWLLDATRAYSGGLLTRSGHAAEVSRRHALFLCDLLERTYAGSSHFVDGELWRSHAAYLSNLRAALEWTATQPDSELLSRLAAAAGPFLLDLSLLDECSRWAERGLQALEATMLGSTREMELQSSLGLAHLFTQGSTERVRVALQRALELAESLGDSYNQMRMLGALNFFHQRIGESRRALALARHACEVAERLEDPACSAMADWLLGSSSHLAGDEPTAVRLGEHALHKPPLSRLVNRARFGFDDHRIRCLCGWARSLFIQGYPDQSLQAVARVIEEASQLGHTIALGLSLVWTTTAVIWAGDWRRAQEAIDRIEAYAKQNGLTAYASLGRGLRGHLLIERGEIQPGVDLLLEFQQMLHATRYGSLLATFSAPLAWGLAQQGRLEQALSTIDTQLVRVEAQGGSFDLPELIRVKAAILLTAGSARDAEAEALLLRSLDQARRQSALAWELRAATTLAQLQLRTGRAAEAATALGAVYSRFTEGFQTPDLHAAKNLLDGLGTAASQ
jgi:predicted ATPase/DNA-binding winged helix-turn-helix (wHTH) protein